MIIFLLSIICFLAIVLPLVLITIFAIKKKWKLMIATIVISFISIILMIFFGFFSLAYLSYYDAKNDLINYREHLEEYVD